MRNGLYRNVERGPPFLNDQQRNIGLQKIIFLEGDFYDYQSRNVP
jgi:hypothetical protein